MSSRATGTLLATLLFALLTTSEVVMGKNIVICIDGTGNHPDQADTPGEDTTNVHRICEALVRDEEQTVEYFQGVGTTGWRLIDAKGEVTGFGADRIRRDAKRFLDAQYTEGDDLFIFGFSRGAAISRDLANHVHEGGAGGHRDAKIEVLGLWDTVGAFGVPLDLFGLPTQSTNLGKQLEVPPNVVQTYHLVAIDEQREPFTPTLVRSAPTVEEVWFAGVHTDVGGGYASRSLADVALHFMISRARNHGLRFDEHKVAPIPANETGLGEVLDNRGDFELAPRRIVVRPGNGSTGQRPKIHASVLRKMEREGAGYRPANVLALDGMFVEVE